MERYRQNPARSQCGMRVPVHGALPLNGRIAEQGGGLAAAKVKNQVWRDIYPPEKALMRGTVFAELDLPFKGRGCRK